MNFSIDSFGKFITVVIISIFLIFVYLFNDLHTKTKELKQLQKNRHSMLIKAGEFRQNLYDTTKTARMYTITSDNKYRNNYYKMLNIKDGKTGKPVHYYNIYWDLPDKLRDDTHPIGDAVSLYDEIKKLPYTSAQLKLLDLAYDKSTKLFDLELKAFKAMDEKNQKKAISLLHSKIYNEAKQDVMIPLDTFLTSIEKQSSNKLNLYNKKIDLLFKIIFFLLLFSLLTFLVSLFVLKRKVIVPIHTLTRAILSYKTGGKNLEEKVFYNDEIGMMTKQFYSMQKKLDEKYEALKLISLTDPLTGIKNRRSFFEISEEYIKLSLRQNKPVSLIILDIDYFKKVNDTHGHIVGDEILKFLTKNVQTVLRDSDIFARYGGEEFVILLPDTDLNDALLVAQKIRSLVEETPYIDLDFSLNITVSIGVKQLENERLLRELIHHADQALYKAKENGRNMVKS